MHSNISIATILYKILKINGLAPFSYFSKENIVLLTSTSTIYSACICMLVAVTTLLCDIELSRGYVPYQQKSIEYIVSYILFYYNFVKIIIIVCLQFICREKLVQLVNQVLSTKSSFEKLILCEPFQDRKIVNYLKNRRILTCIQCTALIVSVGCYVYRTLYLNFVLIILCYVFVLYINLFSMLTTGIYYTGSMILIERFYRSLTNRLKFLLLVLEKKVNIQIYSKIISKL